jgi:hypothetical protein
LLILFSLNVMARESLKDDGLKDSLLFKDHRCLKLMADTRDNSLQRAREILDKGESFVDRALTRDNFVGMADMTVKKAFERY